MTTLRTVLVTGCSRGIGRAICDRLLSQGHTVLGLARWPEMKDAPENYRPLAIDLSCLDEIDGRLRTFLAEQPLLDAVVSNAGGPAFGNLEELSNRQIEDGIALNLTSHMLVARTTLPLLKQRGQSDLVLIGSESALRGGKRGSVYCAAKFGLRGFGQSLRQECASSGVRVTMIHPGMVRTSFFDDLDFEPGAAENQAILADDVAQAVEMVLAARPGTVFDEITLSPLNKVVRNKGRQSPRSLS